MCDTRAAARAQLLRASHLEDLSDANYRQHVPYCLVLVLGAMTTLRIQLQKERVLFHSHIIGLI